MQGATPNPTTRINMNVLILIHASHSVLYLENVLIVLRQRRHLCCAVELHYRTSAWFNIVFAIPGGVVFHHFCVILLNYCLYQGVLNPTRNRKKNLRQDPTEVSTV